MKKLLRNSKKDYYVKVLNYMIKNNIIVNILDIKGNYWREIDTFNEYKKALKKNLNSFKMKKIPVASKLPIQLVAVTGHTKSGKAIMLKLISSFKKYEKITYEPFLEEVGRLNLLKK